MDTRQRDVLTATAYALGFLALGLAQTLRGLADIRFFVWGGVCEWAAYALVAALLGWLVPRIRERRLSFSGTADAPGPPRWFQATQMLLVSATAVLAAWIALDFAFADVGRDQALFGLGGRRAGCVASLMLVGATILMAWQSHGPTRAAWQYAAMASGVLFTSTLGWSSIDPPLRDGVGGWHGLPHCGNLLVSLTMMTLMTGLGLRRVLPAGSDWGDRGRRAMPVFAALAVLLLVACLVLRSSG